MRQAIMTSPGAIELRNVEQPKPAVDEVLLRIHRIGVCGSDVHVFHGRHPYTSYPVVQGHEFSATVEALGDNVSDVLVGDKVTAMPQLTCGECSPCQRGDYHICDKLKVQGFQAPGCAQELFATPAKNVVRLPEDFTFEQGALVEPVAVAVHATNIAGKINGCNVVVAGAGPIGNLVAQVARSRGANVLITDLSDGRLELARSCGVEYVSNANKENLAEATERSFGAAGFQIALECVGVEQTLTAIVQTIAKGGTAVVVGVFAEKPQVDLGLIQDRELRLLGSLMYTREDYDAAIELISSGKVVTNPLETKHFKLDDFADAYQFIQAEGDRSMKVFIDVK